MQPFCCTMVILLNIMSFVWLAFMQRCVSINSRIKKCFIILLLLALFTCTWSFIWQKYLEIYYVWMVYIFAKNNSSCMLRNTGNKAKRGVFSLYICHYAKFCFFFQFGHQTLFLGDQVLFKEQLISNSYKMIGFEEEGPKWNTGQTWVTYHKFQKHSLWSSNLNNYIDYTISVPQNCSNSILMQRFIFVNFLSLVERGGRGESSDSSGKELNRLYNFGPSKLFEFYFDAEVYFC